MSNDAKDEEIELNQEKEVEIEQEKEEKQRYHPFDQMFFGHRNRPQQEQTDDQKLESQNRDDGKENSIMNDFFGGLFKKKI